MTTRRPAALLALLLAVTSGAPLLGATQHQTGDFPQDKVGRRADGSFHHSRVLAAAMKDGEWVSGGSLRLRGGMPRHGGGVGGRLKEIKGLDRQKARGGRPHDWEGARDRGGYWARDCKVCGVTQMYGRSYGSNRSPGYALLPKEHQDCPGKLLESVLATRSMLARCHALMTQ